jgi:hypothetical protein
MAAEESSDFDEYTSGTRRLDGPRAGARGGAGGSGGGVRVASGRVAVHCCYNCVTLLLHFLNVLLSHCCHTVQALVAAAAAPRARAPPRARGAPIAYREDDDEEVRSHVLKHTTIRIYSNLN